jgi:hypothetical protein
VVELATLAAEWLRCLPERDGRLVTADSAVSGNEAQGLVVAVASLRARGAAVFSIISRAAARRLLGTFSASLFRVSVRLQYLCGTARAKWTGLVLALGMVWSAAGVQAYTLKTTKGGQHVRWSTPVITLYVDEKLDRFFGAAVVRTSLTMATDAWRGLERVPDVVISERPAPGYQANARTNGVYLMSPWPFAREQLAVTVSTYDLDGHMIGADVLVNGESDYALLSDGNDTPGLAHHDLAAVLTHEVGHVLGLDESSDDQTATMWPYIRGGDVHQRTLSEDDERGIVAAYQDVVFDTEIPKGCTQASVLGARPDASATQFAACCAAALFVAFRLIRRRHTRHSLPPRAPITIVPTRTVEVHRPLPVAQVWQKRPAPSTRPDRSASL